MKHDFNGCRLSDCEWKQSITAIVVLPINGIVPPLNFSPDPQHAVRPLQQVTLRPDMLSALGYLRIGNTPGDEANCWIHPSNVQIIEVLGFAYWDGGKLEVKEQGATDAVGRQDIRAAA